MTTSGHTPGAPHAQPADALAVVGALAEPNRRALYEYVVRRQSWVGRDEAAEAVGLRRGITAHHLDRLAEDGLLDVSFRRLSGRTGPGAGRPAKLYRRAASEVAVSFPPRHYDLAGAVLAAAVDRADSTGEPVGEALAATAHETGRAIATGAGAGGLDAVLTEQGFEPERLPDGSTLLHNCPFHALAERHTALICGMNLHLLGGLVEGLGVTDQHVALEPAEGACCVRFRTVPPSET